MDPNILLEMMELAREAVATGWMNTMISVVGVFFAGASAVISYLMLKRMNTNRHNTQG